MRPEILNPLFEPVAKLAGIGPKQSKNLTRLLRSADPTDEARIVDLLFHLPLKAIDRRDQPGIANAVEGATQTFKIHVEQHRPPPRGNRRVPYRIDVYDETGSMSLVFFRGDSRWLTKIMPDGEVRYVSGRVEIFNGAPTIVHPDHMLTEEEFAAMPLVEPIYGTTAGLSQKVLAKIIKTANEKLPDLREWADKALIAQQNWPGFSQAIKSLHHPAELSYLEPETPARCRLAHDELLAGQLALGLLRLRMRKSSGISRICDDRLVKKLLEALPYSLTGAQSRSISEIKSDLALPERMLRLLQGDVGSGKTIVALIACLCVIETGAQASIMAPTEILARQHMASIVPLCDQIGVRVALLTGKDKQAQRRETLQMLEDGTIDLVVGTHALFQNQVQFKNLGLAVIDEQHRFGVHQRLTLGEKGQATDILVMTATPIPRTLVLTNYGDMDVSRLDEKPPGRQPIQTNAVRIDRFEELVNRVKSSINDGGKLYWICPLVEESEMVEATAAIDRHKDLQKRLGDVVGLVHGRMTAEEKSEAMEAFKAGRTRVLVATTVIEVGVDVPDATIIVIEHAERFGLAQLHQLRGRVGRGSTASSCILLFHPPLSQTAEARLKIMRETEDGFRIAEEDLKLRGEGEILGTRQSGTPGFNLALMEHHGHILEIARSSAKIILETNPDLTGPKGEALRTLLYLFGQDQAIRLLRAG